MKNETTSESPSAPAIIPMYRDPSDVRLHLRFAVITLLIIALLFVSIGMNIYQFVRAPDLIVAVTTPSGDRVVRINDRDFGQTPALRLSEAAPSNQGKRYLVSEFVKALYGIDPDSRGKDLERAFRMMVPAQAVKYINDLNSRGVLNQQRAESWQAVWTEQDNKIDERDPFTVHIIGEQQITKRIGGQVVHETVQHSLGFKLVADRPRSDRNLMTGFLIESFDGKELARTQPSN